MEARLPSHLVSHITATLIPYSREERESSPRRERASSLARAGLKVGGRRSHVGERIRLLRLGHLLLNLTASCCLPLGWHLWRVNGHLRGRHHWHLRLEVHGTSAHLEVTTVVVVASLIELLSIVVLHLVVVVALVIVVVVVLPSARLEVAVVIVLIVELHLLWLWLLHVEVWHRLVWHGHWSVHVHRHGKLLLRWLHGHGLLARRESWHLTTGHWVKCVDWHLALDWLIVSGGLRHECLGFRWLEYGACGVEVGDVLWLEFGVSSRRSGKWVGTSRGIWLHLRSLLHICHLSRLCWNLWCHWVLHHRLHWHRLNLLDWLISELLSWRWGTLAESCDWDLHLLVWREDWLRIQRHLHAHDLYLLLLELH